MNVLVCIGSSCHLKGSRQVIDQLQSLIEENGLQEKVNLAGTFCMSQCQQGVCVTVDGAFHSVTPDSVVAFFEEHVKAKA